LCNEIEELKNKLQKVTDDLSKINMADTPNGNCHQEKRIQLNLCQANMETSSFLEEIHQAIEDKQ